MMPAVRVSTVSAMEGQVWRYRFLKDSVVSGESHPEVGRILLASAIIYSPFNQSISPWLVSYQVG